MEDVPILPNASRELELLRIELAVTDFLAQRFDIAPAAIAEGASLRQLGIDSMMLLEVMLEVEDRFGVKLRELSLPANPTLHDLVALVERNLADR